MKCDCDVARSGSFRQQAIFASSSNTGNSMRQIETKGRLIQMSLDPPIHFQFSRLFLTNHHILTPYVKIRQSTSYFSSLSLSLVLEAMTSSSSTPSRKVSLSLSLSLSHTHTLYKLSCLFRKSIV